MDDGKKGLLNVCLSVLAPVLILDYCSASGPAFYQLGSLWAIVLALGLPIVCGVWVFWELRRLDPVNVFGLLGALLTALVSLYANVGTEGGAIRPDTPWWYAAKEGLIPLLLGGAVLVTGTGEGSLFRSFVYSDALFDIRAIEESVRQQASFPSYHLLLRRCCRLMAASLAFSAVANFFLALYFLLPVLGERVSSQAESYNYAVSRMTWWGFLLIGAPLTVTLVAEVRYLRYALGRLTSLPPERMMLIGN